MSGSESTRKAMADLAKRHTKITLLGLVVVLLPVAVLTGAIERLQKQLSGALSKISPELEVVGGVGSAVLILVALLAAGWLLGWLVYRTELGRRVIEWEKAKLAGRSPLMTEYAEKKRARATAEAPAPQPEPALVRIAGVWEPGVIVEERASGWATVFVPDIPSLGTGRLCCAAEDQVLRLRVSWDAYRETLKASGSGSRDWLQALSTAQADASETAH